jgi:hypothetical protein
VVGNGTGATAASAAGKACIATTCEASQRWRCLWPTARDRRVPAAGGGVGWGSAVLVEFPTRPKGDAIAVAWSEALQSLNVTPTASTSEVRLNQVESNCGELSSDSKALESLIVWTPLVRCIPNLWHRVGDRLCSPPSLQEHHRPCPLTTQALAAVAVGWGCAARPPLRPLAVVSALRCWRHLLGCRLVAWHALVARCLGPPPRQPTTLLACCLAGECKPAAAQAHPASLSLAAPPTRSMLEPRNLLPAMEQGREGFLRRHLSHPPSPHVTPARRLPAGLRPLPASLSAAALWSSAGAALRSFVGAMLDPPPARTRPKTCRRPPKTRRRPPSNPSRRSSLKSQVQAGERLAQSRVGNRATGESCLG